MYSNYKYWLSVKFDRRGTVTVVHSYIILKILLDSKGSDEGIFY